jgi:4-aminobutyrate aminotransferase/diaminobutyrate-pyruvate transaminase/4-aminobutyrate aminotransferase/(S)-3-amino-2-methylpropionate transaminase
MHKFQLIPFKCDVVKTRYRNIVTPIPSPQSLQYLNDCIKYEPDSMNDQLPVVWDSASNYSIYDISGNKWIDFTSSIFVANVGHSNPKVKDAIISTTNKNLLNAYYYPTKERSEFSKLLVESTPENFDRVLFLSTGSEAVECAIKMSIKHSGKNKIISFNNGYHGKTMGSAMAGGKFKSQEWIPVKTYVTHLPYPDTITLENEELTPQELFEKYFKGLNPSEYSAVIMEPYQGWSAEFASKEYVKLLKEWCNENEVLLIIDEIQSGFGRTGKLFAYEHFEIVPDIIVCAKGISSSLPLSCVITNNKIINNDMSYNSTHGGNPVAVAASNASVKYLLDNDLVNESYRKGEIMRMELLKWKTEMPDYVKKINCEGLLAGVFIKSPNGNDIDFVDMIIEVAMRKGLLSIRTQSGTLKIGPPLTIDDEALIEGIGVLKESLIECLDMLV